MTSCSCRPSFLWASSSSSTSSSSTRTSRSSSRITKKTFVTLGIRPLAASHGRQFQQPPPPPLTISQTAYAHLFFRYSASPFLTPPSIPVFDNVDHGNNNNDNNNNNNNNNNRNGGDSWGWWWHEDEGKGDSSIPHQPLLLFYAIFSRRRRRILLFLLSVLGCFYHFQSLVPALARTQAAADDDNENEKKEMKEEGSVWEISGGKWMRLIIDPFKDAFVVAPGTSSSSASSATSTTSSSPIGELWLKCRDICIRLMLPEGYPDSVTSDYLDYSLWRGVQGVASQISGVLATQALLYAVGLGKGVIPTAAAINWVLKDGIGYLSKILLSKYGRHFDVNPKGWRLFADLLENAAYGLEMVTPAFPHLFVLIGAAAGAGRSAAALIQAATRSCFYAGFAAQRNFAEVIAKGEAQGMVSKSIGIMLGIALANYIGSSTSLSLASFGLITWVHMYCNLKSYQSIQLRTFNPYRASLVFSEYLLSGQVPPVKEVNDEEPLFPAVPFLNLKPGPNAQLAVLSAEAKDAAAEIDRRLQLGAKLSIIANNKQDALALFDLYRDEGYILAEHKGRYCVILKESCSPLDMLKSLFHANYLYWLDKNAGIKLKSAFDDCRPGGRLQISLEYVQREFNHVKYDWELAGWAADGLIARPLPTRIRPGHLTTTPAR